MVHRGKEKTEQQPHGNAAHRDLVGDDAVTMSMNVAATNPLARTRYTGSFQVRPKWLKKNKKTSAVNNSTTGYCQEILVLQNRQRAFKTRKLNSGILSYQRMGFWHPGQWEAGNTIDSLRGIR
jgi:hypothetical protein